MSAGGGDKRSGRATDPSPSNGETAEPGKPTRVKKALPDSEKGKATEKAGQLVGVGGRIVSDAKKIKEANPEAYEEVKSGKKTITKVKREMKREEHAEKVKAAKAAPKPLVIEGPYDLILAEPPWRRPA